MRIIHCEQGSATWLQHRLGVITGTRLEDAFKHSESLKNELISERMATFVPPSASSAAMQRGNDLEPFARREYELKTGKTVEQIGFIAHPTRDDIGLSPDGIVSNGKRAVEFKCPASKTHVAYMRQHQVPKKYLFQLAAYFLNIPTLKSIDFVSYDELNEVRPLHILPLTLDDVLTTEYPGGRGKTIGSMDHLESRIFAFADSVQTEYQRLVF